MCRVIKPSSSTPYLPTVRLLVSYNAKSRNSLRVPQLSTLYPLCLQPQNLASHNGILRSSPIWLFLCTFLQTKEKVFRPPYCTSVFTLSSILTRLIKKHTHLPPTMSHSSSILDTLSPGTYAPDQAFPTTHCLPALWLLWLIAVVLAALGFAIIGVMKISRYCQISPGREDVYFNDFWLGMSHRGGNIGAGTSGILTEDGERYIDIEQRAALYSPCPRTVGLGGECGNRRGVAEEGTVVEKIGESTRVVEDDEAHAASVDWSGQSIGRQIDSAMSRSQQLPVRFVSLTRAPSYSFRKGRLLLLMPYTENRRASVP